MKALYIMTLVTLLSSTSFGAADFKSNPTEDCPKNAQTYNGTLTDKEPRPYAPSKGEGHDNKSNSKGKQ